MTQLRSKIALSAACCAALIGSPAYADDGGLTVPETVDAPIRLAVENAADGLDPSAMLQVYVGAPDACCAGKSPMAGRYGLDGDTITFVPAFDFVIGQGYTVRTVHSMTDQDTRLTGFAVEPDIAPVPPQVLAVYPSGPQIPENTLRFYIHFSTPMSPHQSTDFIQLVDADGTADTAAFMTFKQELWNEDRTRLTLLMDPGRIKRGVAQNVTLGPALNEGESYALVIKEGWSNAHGDQQAPEFMQPFVVSAALRSIPDIGLWDIHSPQRSTRDPMVVHFDRPFDVALAQDAITLMDDMGHIIAGTVSVQDHQHTWRFVPQSDWAGGAVRLVVDARLEDVAGNNFRELLDHSVDTDVRALDQTSVQVPLLPAPE